MNFKSVELKTIALFLNIAFLTVVFFPSCNNNNGGDTPQEGKLAVIFKAKYDGQTMVLNKTYKYFDQSDITFTRSEFFMTDLMVLDQNSQQKTISNTSFVNFTEKNKTEASAEQGISYEFTLPVGSYKNLGFHIGLPPSLNSMQPSDFTVGSPLAEGTNYWAGWKSYIFSKFEGTIKNQNFNDAFGYHSGFDEAYRTVQFTNNFDIKANETTTLVIEFDHKPMFGNNADYFDIYSQLVFHDTKGGYMARFMDLMSKSFSIK